MGKKTKLSKTQKPANCGYTVLCGVISVYWILYCSITPIIICMIPIIPYIITNEPNWMWLMLLSFPVGVSIGMKMWEPEFISRHL